MRYSILKFSLYLFGIGIFLFLVSCQPDDPKATGDIDLSFSQDTLTFDTIFTSIGSTTKLVKIFNNENSTVEIGVKLRNNTGFFRLNVDGFQGDDIKNVRINAKDSIYAFIEVTIDPSLPTDISPFIVEDALIAYGDESEDEIPLIAFGQNANYIPNNTNKGGAALISCDFQNVIFDDPKPYVIYGVLYVDSCTLTIPAGTQLYIHGGVVLSDGNFYNDGEIRILKNGKINIDGTYDNPVIIQGDRLEQDYDRTPGQYYGIGIYQGSTQNVMHNFVLKNAINGILVDSASQLSLKDGQIINTLGFGIVGIHANITAENCLIADNYGGGFRAVYGGNYDFRACSFANYQSKAVAFSLQNFVCLKSNDNCAAKAYNDVNMNLIDCVIAGNDDDEFVLSAHANAAFNYSASHCAVRYSQGEILDGFPTQCQNCFPLQNNDRVFANRNTGNFQPDSMSVLLTKGIFLPSLPMDITGKTRKSTPDIGCYEL